MITIFFLLVLEPLSFTIFKDVTDVFSSILIFSSSVNKVLSLEKIRLITFFFW